MVIRLLLLVFYLASPAATGETILISSSPSLPRDSSESVFIPIATLLSRTTGKNFEYRYPVNWPAYVQDIRDSKYGLLFDEPHLVAWRAERGIHAPLLRLPGAMQFVVVALERDDSIVQLSDLAGLTVCTNPPPALDGLVLLAQFRNPARQPQIRQKSTYQDAYNQLLAAECRAAVLPYDWYTNASGEDRETRVIFLSEEFPNWTLSGDSAIPQNIRLQILNALLDPAQPAAYSLARIAGDVPNVPPYLLPASDTEYRNHSKILEGFWGLH